MKIGQLLGNRYEILSKLGGGGMAIVYKAKCTLLERIVTIKVLRPEFTSDEEFVNRFRHEAQAVARLSHPNIVNVYDVGQEENVHYFVMEYIEGKNLKELIKEKNNIPVNEAVHITKQICEGLSHAHENGIIHRDIKPHNILIANDGRVKVTDFGIARAVTDSSVTQHGTVLGSVHYISPEQAKGHSATEKSDLYSAGVVLFEMVTGKVPFEADTPVSVALKHVQDQPQMPSELNPDVSEELDKVILRAMEKDPNFRYQSAKEMAADLNTVLEGRISDMTKAIDMDDYATRVLPVVDQDEVKNSDQKRGKKRKKNRVWPKVLVVVSVVLIGLLAGLAYGFDLLMTVPEVKVPNVEGMPMDTAIGTLKEMGLKYDEPEHQNDPDVPAGNVISQDPEAGTMIKKNRPVKLYISKGPEIVEVPDVRKKDVKVAKIQLENEGFKVNIRELYNEDVVEDGVISQIPDAGEKAEVGSTVRLEVSKGPQPKYVIVPDLIGLSLEEAKKALIEVNLELNPDIGQEKSYEYEAGLIIAQEPKAGDNQILEGEEVKVVLSQGPGAKEKTAKVEMRVPDDGQSHTIKIVVSDVKGTREVYNETLESGDFISEKVTYYNEAKIEVWMDGNILAEEIKN